MSKDERYDSGSKHHWDNMKRLKIVGLVAIVIVFEFASCSLAEDAAIEINGKINPKITISINPDTVWDFGSVDPEAIKSRDDILTVSSNKPWTVTAKDMLGYSKPLDTKGHMVKWTGSAWLSSKLGDSLKIINAGTTYDLANDPVIASGVKGNNKQVQITLTQAVQFTDDPTEGSHYYRMSVTFVGAQKID